MRCLGEATGLLLLEPEDHPLWLASSAWCMQFSTAKTRSEHEDITQRMFTLGRVDAQLFDEDDHLFMEVDTPDEYAVLRTEVAPRLAGLMPATWRDAEALRAGAAHQAPYGP
jgi:hypothetical protein